MAETSPKTGLVCPACKEPVGVIIKSFPGVLILRCSSCGNRWTTSESSSTAEQMMRET
jgi:hypothetical protein